MNRAGLESALKAQYHFKLNADGTKLWSGICPRCDKKKLYSYTDKLNYLHCSRKTCGYSKKTRDLFPEYFEKDKPTPALDYLNYKRGLSRTFLLNNNAFAEGFYKKGDKQTATARFYISKEENIYMERFCQPLEIDGEIRKQNFHGSYGGLWWTLPNFQFNDGDEIWLCEGVIDALSLLQKGIKAVAILSCRNFPEKALKSLSNANKINWILALDNDEAGTSSTRKFLKLFRDLGLQCESALTSDLVFKPQDKKIDWNDCLRQGLLDDKEAAERFKLFAKCYFSNSIIAKVDLAYQIYYSYNFTFNHEGAHYAIEEKRPVKVCNAELKPLYIETDEKSENTKFCLEVLISGKRRHKLDLNSKQLSKNSEFKAAIIQAGGALWTGSQANLDTFLSNLIEKQEIHKINYLGYHANSGVYIFPNYAIKQNQVVPVDNNNCFSIDGLNFKSSLKVERFQLSNDKENYAADWVHHLFKAFGANGLFAAVFWFASLFAIQTREKQSSFPFLQIIGEAGSGKTTLIEFLWRLFGRENEEGFNPNKSSEIATMRKLSQFSNIPNVFNEADSVSNSHQKRFDWEILKDIYNGRVTRVIGTKTTDNNTLEMPFLGSLVISQNEQIEASQAVQERLLVLRFSKENQSLESKQAVDYLNSLSSEDLSYFLILACSNAGKIISSYFNNFKRYEEKLRAYSNNERIIKNYAQLMGFAAEFSKLVKLNNEENEALEKHFYALTAERMQELENDSPLVETFWEIYEFLRNEGEIVNYSTRQDFLAINLLDFYMKAGKYGLNNQLPPSTRTLLKALRNSKKIRLINENVSVRHRNKIFKCYIFENQPE